MTVEVVKSPEDAVRVRDAFAKNVGRPKEKIANIMNKLMNDTNEIVNILLQVSITEMLKRKSVVGMVAPSVVMSYAQGMLRALFKNYKGNKEELKESLLKEFKLILKEVP